MARRDGQLTPPVGASDHARGPNDAPITLVEYGDYECHHCGQAYPIVKRVQAQLGHRLRFVFRNFPLSEFHPNAASAAAFAEAAALQGKFWEAHDILFENQTALSIEDLARYGSGIGLDLDALDAALITDKPDARVRADFRSGVESGVSGTPTFFINGARYEGDWSNERAFADALLAAQRMN